MRLSFISSAVVAALVGLNALAVAQQPGPAGQPGGRRPGGPGGGGGFPGGGMGPRSRLSLLGIPEIRKELELADEQITEIEKIADEIRAKYGFGGRPGGGGPGDRGPGDRGPGRGDGDRSRRNNEGAQRNVPASWFFAAAQEPQNQPGRGGRFGGGGFPMFTPEQRAEMEKQRAERNREEKARLADVLLPHQIKRLNEIFVQQAGMGALRDEDVATELGISEAQKAKLAEVQEANDAASRPLIGQLFQGGGRGGDEETRAKIAEMRKVNDGKLLAVLSPEQQKKFEAMKGKPFAMPENTPRFGPGSNRGPGGNRSEGNNN